MEEEKYSFKPVFLSTHEKEYRIFKNDKEIAELHIFPKFKDARLITATEELYISEKNCEEVLEKIGDEELRKIVKDLLSKNQICK